MGNIVIGITGGIASGKSLVTNRLKALGYTIVDCDEISHEVFEESKTKELLKKAFNIDSVTRSSIARIVFSDKSKLSILNNIMYPLILKRLEEVMKANKKLKCYFVDVPLLYERNMEYLFNKIIFVNVSSEIQIERLMKRDNIDYDYAKEKIDSQLSMKEKEKKTIKNNNYIINNNGIIEDTYKEIDNIIKELKI